MRNDPNYLYLMSGLLVSIALITSAPSLSTMEMAGVCLAAIALLVTVYAVASRGRTLYIAIVLGALGLLPIARIRLSPGGLTPALVNAIYAFDILLWVLLTFTTTVIVFRGIMTARRIGTNEIFGAIYVYLLIGVLFAQIYQLLLVVQPAGLYFDPARFPAPPEIANGLVARSAGDLVYFSFVTLGTVGFGDVTPATPLARFVCLVEAVLGIMYVATMIARFVSIQSSSGQRGPREEAP